MSCHGNGKISYDPNGGILEDIFFSVLVGPSVILSGKYLETKVETCFLYKSFFMLNLYLLLI